MENITPKENAMIKLAVDIHNQNKTLIPIKLKVPELKTVEDIHWALASGYRISWGSGNYEVFGTKITKDKSVYEFQSNFPTTLDDIILECRCVSNYFGGLLHKSEIKNCYIDTENKSELNCFYK